MGRSSVQRKKKKKEGEGIPTHGLEVSLLLHFYPGRQFSIYYTVTGSSWNRYSQIPMVILGVRLAWLIQAFLTTSRESQCV